MAKRPAKLPVRVTPGQAVERDLDDLISFKRQARRKLLLLGGVALGAYAFTRSLDSHPGVARYERRFLKGSRRVGRDFSWAGRVAQQDAARLYWKAAVGQSLAAQPPK